LRETERALLGKHLGPSLLAAAKTIVAQEIRPIDDIRSVARYRTEVAGNLVMEFLEKLASTGKPA
jgi:CO/xanthine dehydrogenase FAD-binding subunit